MSETGIIQALSDILQEKNEISEEEVIDLPFVGAVSEKRDIGVIAKTEEAKRVLSRFIPMKGGKPDIWAGPKELGKETGACFDETRLTYLFLVVHKIIELTGEKCLLVSVVEPGLMKIESPDFDFMLTSIVYKGMKKWKK